MPKLRTPSASRIGAKPSSHLSSSSDATVYPELVIVGLLDVVVCAAGESHAI
jgi:hypothetical protein